MGTEERPTPPSTPSRRTVTLEQIVAAYKETGSVWKAGKRLGLTGQSVHERLRRLGYTLQHPTWTTEEDEELRSLVANGVRLGEVVHRLGRTYASVACRASELSVRSKRGAPPRRVPRGIGLNKRKTLRHMKQVEKTNVPVTRYARRMGLNIETLVTALQVHAPERWQTYVETHSNIPRKKCGYCSREYIPMLAKQLYCSRKCQADAERDRSYFGGRRRMTIGLDDGTCQLCGDRPKKGLSSHHIFGKENDPENLVLIALCRGCHKLVTLLGARRFVNDTTTWESLIQLAWLRRNGAQMMKRKRAWGIYASVELEAQRLQDDEPARPRQATLPEGTG